MITAATTQRRTKGFTLVELLLTVAMLLMLAGAVIYNFGVLDKAARFDETATAVESLLRYARAQASSRGREVRVVFGDTAPASSTASNSSGSDSGSTNSATSARGVQILWEPDPLGEPGHFKPLPGAERLVNQLNEIARVTDVRPPGTNAPEPVARQVAVVGGVSSSSKSSDNSSSETPAASTMPVTFHPDGSSDSVEIVLGSISETDTRGVLVSLSGTSGALSHRVVSMDENGMMEPERVDELKVSQGDDPAPQP